MGPQRRARGRGRGQFRGRGGRGRGGKRQRIDSERDVEKTEPHNHELDYQSSQDEGASILIDDDESEDEDETSSTRPYMTLLQGFTGSIIPEAKKRKLSHEPSTTSLPEPQAPLEEGSDDDKDVDFVEEPENDRVDDMIEEQENDEDDDEEDPSDPFDTHFANPEENSTSQKIKSLQQGLRLTKRSMLQNLRAVSTSPNSDDSVSELPGPIAILDEFKLKQKLKDPASRCIGSLSDLQKFLGPLIFNYHDISFNDRTLKNASSIRKLLCLHALNHVFKTRDRVIKNNFKLAKQELNPDLEFRDQGFTRPKVLFLLPTRNSCLKMVNTIRDLCESYQQENRKRFDDAYSEKDVEFGANKPADFRDLFEGNDDDMFRIGMKLTRKTMKYFAQFYTSDILFVSPLGLRTAIGSDSEGEKKKKLDFDFLSSIEIVIVDQADALLMQNWEHVEFIFEHLNLQPKDAHGCDFTRVRNWYLEDQSKYFRQTIVLSSFNTPELSELMRAHCHNWAGQVRLQPEYPGILQKLGVKAKQTFSRFEPESIDVDPDARFNYFVSAVVPSLTKTREKDISGTLIFIHSYLDFVRVRNYFNTSPTVLASVGYISEYSAVPDASRTRSHFMNQKHQILLYTERAHHFRRYVIKGVRRVIFYGLPDNPVFYKEIAGDFLSDSERNARLDPGKASIRVIFSKYDAFKLERVVGTQRAGKMVSDRGDTFEFI